MAMNKLFFDDQETVMAYISVMMLKEDADEYAPAISKVLTAIQTKIEGYFKANPLAMTGLIKTLESEPELMNHPRAAQLLELLKHIVGAATIMNDITGMVQECPLCNGYGKFIDGSGLPCPRCHGSGKLNKNETYN